MQEGEDFVAEPLEFAGVHSYDLSINEVISRHRFFLGGEQAFDEQFRNIDLVHVAH